MARKINALQALEQIMQDREDENDSSTSSPEDTSDTEWDSVDSGSPNSSDDSSDDSSDEESESTAKWTSKNGQVSWSTSHLEMRRYIPAKTQFPGPTRYAVARITAEIKSCWDLFITDEIMNLIVKMTNLQGRRTIQAWKDTDKTELEAFFGLLILAGVYRSRHESTRSLWNEKTGRAIFPSTMPRYRFEMLASKLRFDDPLTRCHRLRNNRLAAISDVWEKWEHQLSYLFIPARDICVDEQLVPFRGRCKFKQYIPSKPAKYGLKVWVACDVSTSYAFKMQVYTGKQEGTPAEINQGKRVVLELTEGLAGHTVTCDNFFTSYSLGEELLKRKMGLVGTIRSNKAELPPVLVNKKQRAVQSAIFGFTKTHTAVSYIPKRNKNVLLLSTVHRQPDINNEAHQKPQIIPDYNRCKGAVDNLDKCVGTYSVRRKTCRWPLMLFYNILDVSAFNSFVLWMAVEPTWNQSKKYRRRLFLEQLARSLVTLHLQQRQRLPRAPSSTAMVADAQRPQRGEDISSVSGCPGTSKTCKRRLFH